MTEILNHPLTVAMIMLALTTIAGWVGMVRRTMKQNELRLASIEQFKSNNLDENSVGQRPILQVVEYRLTQLEEAREKQETESIERFKSVMRKFDDLGKEIDRKFDALERKVERRFDAMTAR